MNSKNIYLDNPQFEEIKNQAKVVDVRSKQEYLVLAKIVPSVNIEINKLVQNPNHFLPDKKELIVTVCNAGNRSSEAASFLRDAGYTNTFVLTNGVYGYIRWKEKQKK